MTTSKKKCRFCDKFGRTEEMRKVPLGYIHDTDTCIMGLANDKREKTVKARKKIATRRTRADKARLNANDLKWQKHRTKVVVHELVKLLDAKEPCIVCQGFDCGNRSEWDAGHYLTKAAHPELKFDPRNIFKQCSLTNTASTGRSSAEASIRVKFEQGIIKRIGMAHLEWLKSHHEPRKFTCQELADYRAEVAADVARLKRGEEPLRQWRALPCNKEETA